MALEAACSRESAYAEEAIIGPAGLASIRAAAARERREMYMGGLLVNARERANA